MLPGELPRGRQPDAGTPQGAVISPVLPISTLHYVLDLWVNQWRRREATGDVIMVRYADDAVLGFQRQDEAERYLEQLREGVGSSGWSYTWRKRV